MDWTNKQDWDSAPEQIQVGEFLVPTDPMDLLWCDSCQ